MPKDIYKTFKRSISAVTGGGSSASLGAEGSSSSTAPSTSQSVKYRGGSGRTWIHPPDFLINGRVEYVARFLGTTETSKAQGSDVAREAIHAIRFQRDVKRSEQSRETSKLTKVDIQISIDNVVVADYKTKQVLYKFPLGRISFCADDKDDKRMFSFIARAEGTAGKHSCFAFTSEKLAEEITLTIGQAFDLAYKRYMDKNRNSLENQKQIFILRKRIAELEAENQVLSERLAESIRSNKGYQPQNYGNSLLDTPIAAPALPTSPMPHGPPPNLSSSIYSTPKVNDLSTPPSEMAPKLAPIVTSNGQSSHSSSSSPVSGPAPTLPPPRAPAIAPPPPVAPRPRGVTSPKTSIIDGGRKQLEGLNLGENNSTHKKTEDLFDDSFDPRAGEKKVLNYDPFGEDFKPEKFANGKSNDVPSTSTVAPKTAADFQAMIDKVEMKLAQFNNGTSDDDFEFGQLQTGDLHGIEAENDYGTPSDRLNPSVMNLKK